MKRLAVLLVVAAFAFGTSLAGEKGTKSAGTTTKGKKEQCEETKGCCGGKDAKAKKTSDEKKQGEEKAPESK
jgi:hypothetical protein